MVRVMRWSNVMYSLFAGMGILISSAAHGQDLQAVFGKWSDSPDKRTCDITVGSSPDDATVFRISPTSIDYYEIDCAVKDAKSTPDGVQMNVDCFKGAGVLRWFETVRLKPLAADRLQFSTSNRKPPLSGAAGQSSTLYRCSADEGSAPNTTERQISQWSHNGSVMSVSETNGSIEIDYLEPRAGMKSVGVRPQTMLFYGSKNGNRIEGNAYIFDSRCGPVSYGAEGQFSADGHSLLLSGQSPRVNGNCDVVRSVAEILRFERRP
jgi:hypothetical protein